MDSTTLSDAERIISPSPEPSGEAHNRPPQAKRGTVKRAEKREPNTMEEQMAEPAGMQQDPQPGAQDPKSGEGGGAKGDPDLKAENVRLSEEFKAEKKRADDLQTQLDALNESLAKALTEEDVKAAVEAAKTEAEEAHKASEEAWEAERKRLSVENALIAGGCTDTVGCMAHLDLSKIEVASDGHLSGLDAEALAKEHPHLFRQGGNTGTVASAAAPGGPAKTMTKEEIMKETDPTKRRQLISEHMDLFE